MFEVWHEDYESEVVEREIVAVFDTLEEAVEEVDDRWFIGWDPAEETYVVRFDGALVYCVD